MGDFTTEIANVWRRLVTVNHTFIEIEMTGSLDDASIKVDVVGIAHGFLETKKDTGTGIDSEFAITSFSGHSIDTAAKDTEEADVDAFASAYGDTDTLSPDKFKRGRSGK